MDFFRGELNTYGDLKVGGDFTLEASLSPLVSANDVEVRVITSHNLELTGLSDTRFLSRIGVDQNTTVLFPLRIIRAGEHEIGVSVTGAGELGGKEKNI